MIEGWNVGTFGRWGLGGPSTNFFREYTINLWQKGSGMEAVQPDICPNSCIRDLFVEGLFRRLVRSATTPYNYLSRVMEY